MKTENITAEIEMTPETIKKAQCMMTSLEDAAPSDASVFLKLEIIDDKYVGSLQVRSIALKVDVEKTNFDVDALLKVLNVECKDQIEECKTNR